MSLKFIFSKTEKYSYIFKSTTLLNTFHRLLSYLHLPQPSGISTNVRPWMNRLHASLEPSRGAWALAILPPHNALNFSWFRTDLSQAHFQTPHSVGGSQWRTSFELTGCHGQPYDLDEGCGMYQTVEQTCGTWNIVIFSVPVQFKVIDNKKDQTGSLRRLSHGQSFGDENEIMFARSLLGSHVGHGRTSMLSHGTER